MLVLEESMSLERCHWNNASRNSITN